MKTGPFQIFSTLKLENLGQIITVTEDHFQSEQVSLWGCLRYNDASKTPDMAFRQSCILCFFCLSIFYDQICDNDKCIRLVSFSQVINFSSHFMFWTYQLTQGLSWFCIWSPEFAFRVLAWQLGFPFYHNIFIAFTVLFLSVIKRV